MKIIHTSDWHLGMTYKNGVTYREDQIYFIRDICKIAVEENVDAIMISGDVFDKSIASQDALELYDDVMTYICLNLDIPVYIIAGNHDGAGRISSLYRLLKNSGMYIAGALQSSPIVETIGDVDIYMLPWISTDKVKAVFPDAADDIRSLEDAYKVVLDSYREDFKEGRKHILMSHSFIVDAETSVSDKAAEVGRATMIGSYVFDGFDYVALGHLHGPQQINEHIRYSGTPMAYSFGKEEAQVKSVTILDTDTMSITEHPVNQLRRRTTLKGTYEELSRADYPAEIRDGYVRLEVSDAYVGLDMMASFREKYKNLLEISGRNAEKEDAKITMTIEEFEQASMDPENVFMRFCEDILDSRPNDRIIDLFKKAVEDYEKEAATL